MRLFLMENHKALRQCEDHWELFGSLNFYWNYLAYDLLDHMIKELTKKHKFFQSVSGEMAVYKSDIQKFRKQTTLELFCKTEPPAREHSPAGFMNMVARFNWPKKSTLDDVERFRIQYARCYDLPTCAMLLDSIGIGSFIITWFIPTEMVQVMRKKRALSVLWEFRVIELQFHVPNNVCIYQSSTIQRVDAGSHTAVKVGSKTSTTELEEDGYQFCKEPATDFICPVAMTLLLQPHLTSCCGNHLSYKVVQRLQERRQPCPLCKKKGWSSVLNKHFQRQVKSLHVFCRHEIRGCGWQGELGKLKTHIQSCPMKDGPLMTELVKSKVYTDQAVSRVINARSNDKDGKVSSSSIRISEMRNSEQSWLFDESMGRQEAEVLLKLHNTKGMFLVRKSKIRKGEHTLSLYDGTEVKHYRIHSVDNLFFMATRAAFFSLDDLVQYYSQNADGLAARLSVPCSKQVEQVNVLPFHLANDELVFGNKYNQGQWWEEFEGKWRGKGKETPIAITAIKKADINIESFMKVANQLKDRICHKNLVKFYGVCTDNKAKMFIVTEFVSQSNLLSYLHQDGKALRVPDLIYFATQIASGMAYLEQYNIIHGDLAARNVMVAGKVLCKVTNIAIRKHLNTDSSSPYKKWMSPEAARYGRFTIKSDVWSFGILVYELVTYGRFPYPGMSNAEVFKYVEEGYRMPCPPNTPSNLYRLMLGTWKKEPMERFTFDFIYSILSDFSSVEDQYLLTSTTQ